MDSIYDWKLMYFNICRLKKYKKKEKKLKPSKHKCKIPLHELLLVFFTFCLQFVFPYKHDEYCVLYYFIKISKEYLQYLNFLKNFLKPFLLKNM